MKLGITTLPTCDLHVCGKFRNETKTSWRMIRTTLDHRPFLSYSYPVSRRCTSIILRRHASKLSILVIVVSTPHHYKETKTSTDQKCMTAANRGPLQSHKDVHRIYSAPREVSMYHYPFAQDAL
jgi:hypothetical protein